MCLFFSSWEWTKRPSTHTSSCQTVLGCGSLRITLRTNDYFYKNISSPSFFYHHSITFYHTSSLGENFLSTQMHIFLPKVGLGLLPIALFLSIFLSRSFLPPSCLDPPTIMCFPNLLFCLVLLFAFPTLWWSFELLSNFFLSKMIFWIGGSFL